MNRAAKTPAMNTEEAALLPAIARRAGLNTSLLSSLRSTAGLRRMTVSGAVSTVAAQSGSQSAGAEQRKYNLRDRAALHHALRR